MFVIKLYARSFRPVPPSAEGSSSRPAVATRYSLIVDYFGNEIAPQDFEEICSFLEKEFAVDLAPSKSTSDEFDDLKEEGRVSPAMPSKEDLAAAEILAKKEARTLAISIKQAGGLLVGDLSRQLPQATRAQTEQIRDSLLNAGIVASETVVICKKTNAQVSRVPEESVLAILAREGLRCACGNSIADEKVDTAVSVSDRGQWLLDGSHWFTLLLIDALVRIGVPLERILVDQVSGGDEMDCIADLGNGIALFELKDKEFSLGNAYSFGAKIGIIEPRYPVIVTTEYVGNDAKEHFARSRRRPRESWATADENATEQNVIYIEGMNDFMPGLMKLVSRAALIDAENALENVLPRASLPLSVVLKSLDERFLTIKEASSLQGLEPVQKKSHVNGFLTSAARLTSHQQRRQTVRPRQRERRI